MANTKITTNVIADGAITSAKLDSSSLSIPSTATATTQSAGDNSTKVATTAYVETAVSNLVSAAPAALDTLDELAAALGDDANFSTTITNSLALKAPLASPDFTGNVQVGTDSGDAFNSSSLFRGQSSDAAYVQLKVGDTASGGLLIGDTTDDFRGGLISYGTAHSTLANNTIIFANNNQTITASPTGVRLNGTSIARDPLHVHRAATGDCQIHMTNTSTGTSSTDGMTIFTNSAGSGIWQRENCYFRIATNNAERFRLAANGELTLKSDTDVIATFMNDSDNDHNFKFNLVDASDLAVMYLNGKDGGDNKFIIGYGSTHTSTPNMLALKSNTASGELGFFTNSTQRMHITPTGEVGIGNSSPQRRLTVGDGSGSEVMSIYAGSTSASALHFTDTNTTTDYQGFVTYDHVADALRFGAAEAEGMRLTSTGLGIGTTSPNQLLHLENSALATDDARIRIVSGTSGEASILFGDSGYGSRGRIVYDNATDSLQIWGADSTTSAERMRINSSGNVGIGTAAPDANLQVRGSGDRSIAITSGTAGAAILNFGDTASGDFDIGSIIYDNANNSMQFKTNNGERMRIDSSGRVSIGTTSTNAPLRVKVATDANFTVQNTSSTVQLQAINDAGNAFTTLDIAGNPIVFSANGSERMRLTTNGLAIGFTSTDASLDADGYIRSKHATANGLLLNTGNDQWAIRNVSSSLSFEDDGTQRFVIDPSGRFAMGNTPSISTNYILSIDSNASGQAAGIHFTHGTKNLYLGYNSTSATDNAEMFNAANGYLRFGTNNLERMRISSGGVVNINHTSGALNNDYFSVKQAAANTSYAAALWNSASGSYQTILSIGTGTSYTHRGGINYDDTGGVVQYLTTSDSRLKTEVGDADGLSIINALRPIKFTWNETGNEQQGFFAQEVKTVVPSAVAGVEGEDDYLSMDYSRLVTPLVKAVQELSAKVDTLEAEIEVLRNG